MDTWIRGVWIKGGDGKGGWLLDSFDAVKFYILRIEGFRFGNSRGFFDAMNGKEICLKQDN